MLIIELTDDKFGKAMHNITCIEEKLNEIKKVFEEDSVSGNFRKYEQHDNTRYYDDRMYRDRDYEYRKNYDKKYM